MAKPPNGEEERYQRNAETVQFALRFVWATLRLIDRFTDGFRQRPRWEHERRTGLWPAMEIVRAYELYRADGYFVLVAALQAVRWIETAEQDLGLGAGELGMSAAMVARVKALRDVLEHWNEQREHFARDKVQSAFQKKTSDAFKDLHPDAGGYPGDGWRVVNGVAWLDSLSLGDLADELRATEDRLTAIFKGLHRGAGYRIE